MMSFSLQQLSLSNQLLCICIVFCCIMTSLQSYTYTLQICSLMRGGIAERGGVRVGHRIIEINGQSVVAMAHEKIVHALSVSVGEVCFYIYVCFGGTLVIIQPLARV